MPNMNNLTRDEIVADLRANVERLTTATNALLQRCDTLPDDALKRASNRAMEWAVVMERTGERITS